MKRGKDWHGWAWLNLSLDEPGWTVGELSQYAEGSKPEGRKLTAKGKWIKVKFEPFRKKTDEEIERELLQADIRRRMNRLMCIELRSWSFEDCLAYVSKWNPMMPEMIVIVAQVLHSRCGRGDSLLANAKSLYERGHWDAVRG